MTTSPRPCGSPNGESAPRPLIIVCKLVLLIRRPPAFLVDVSLHFPAFIYVTEPLQTQQSWAHLFPRGKSYSQHLNFLQGHNGMPACQPVSLMNTLTPHRPSVNLLTPMSPHITPEKSFSGSQLLTVRPKSTSPLGFKAFHDQALQMGQPRVYQHLPLLPAAFTPASLDYFCLPSGLNFFY